ncbi:hypothetical protein J1C56_01965 [Aminobacter anthyllidis]|uniref:Uncharacterized protein n=1 Tax=Aminobacter anthyllidis TaxID=1035067 RepID=A0A9X1D0Y0_9HYPH|nr:hypothetical protein [Aminobacter anthyllidis]MBT1154350.1 hypothetical protein [Aminobacter anthyllidis]
MSGKTTAFVCWLVGHKPVSTLSRSPNTVYTHMRKETCARCGKVLVEERMYYDARTEPEMFRGDK